MPSNLIDTNYSINYSTEVEKKFLCAIFLNNENLSLATDLIRPEMFHVIRHQRIFMAMIEAYSQYQSVDLVSVGNVLGEQINQSESDEYLLEILKQDIVPSAIKPFAKIIKEKFNLHRIRRWHSEVGLEIKSNSIPHELVQHIERSVVDLSDTSVVKKPDIQSIQVDILNEWEKIESGEIKVIAPPKELFVRQSNATDTPVEFMPYYWPDSLIAVGGWTSNGKSTLLAELNKGIGRAGGSQLIFSTEDSRKGKLLSLISNVTGIHKTTFRKNRANGYAFRQFMEASDEIKSWPIKIFDDVRTIEEIRLKIIQEKMKRDVNVVFLDYVQNLRGKGSIYEKMSHAALMMQEIVIDLNVCFVFFSQLDNQSKRDAGAVMNLKGAGELSAVVDTKIILAKENQNKPGGEHDLRATFEKNRDGPCRFLEWKFTKNWTGIESRY